MFNRIYGGVSNLQEQIDTKHIIITGAATTITGEDLTKSRALVSLSLINI